MAHKLDFSKGRAAFVANGAPGWHGLGVTFPEGNTLTAADALEHGGLNFDVLKLPNIHYLPNGEEIVSEDSFFTVRLDTNAILGSRLGSDYHVLQNVEALDIVDEVLQAGTATIETAGAIDEGRKVFICLKASKPIKVTDEDEIKPYVLIATSHDGSMSITAKATNIRVVCNNTLSAALREKGGADTVKIRHTSGAEYRLREAAKILGLLSNASREEEIYQEMHATTWSPAQAWDYFGNVFFSAEEIKEIKSGRRAEQVLSAQKRNTLEKVLNFAHSGTGQGMARNNGQETAWSSYNAVTGYIARKSFNSWDDRANNILFGTGADVIERAHTLAANPAQIISLRANLANLNLN